VTAGTGTSRPTARPTSVVPGAARPRVDSSFGSLSASFEPNVGQAPAGVEFLIRGAAASLTATGAVLSGGSEPVTLRFVGASPSARTATRSELPGKANYLRGDDPSRWHTDVPTYGAVRYDQLYPGVDLVWYGDGPSLEYDLVVAPGADPDAVSFRLDGARSPAIDDGGALVAGEVRFQRPVAYQSIGAERRTVASRYVVRDGQVAFALGEYDRSLPLVVDPEITYTYTFADASKDTSIAGIAVDASGAAYVAGQTRTEGTGGVLDTEVFVAKLNPEGTGLVYSTTIGGSSGTDFARDVAVDAAGNAFITGSASSSDFPTTSGAFQTTKGSPNGTADAFVTKLGPAGDAFVYSSFLGGTNGAFGNEVEVDASGNAYVAGFTQSSNFPTTAPSQPAFGGVQDAFLTKVSPAGSAKIYSTFLGGADRDTGASVAVDASGNAYVVGLTLSTNFPVTTGAVQAASGGGTDAFWAKYDASGQRTASTYLGGSGFDSAIGVAVGTAGTSYVTGETDSSNFPLVAPFQSTIAGDRDAFVAELSSTGTALGFSTLYGGSDYDFGTTVVLDGAGALYVVGTTESSNFPVVDPFQPTFGGGISDAFVLQLRLADGLSGRGTPAGPSVGSSSYQGGTGRESGAAAGSADAGCVVTCTGKQKDSVGGSHDEARVSKVMYDTVPRPDLAISDGAAVPRAVGSGLIHNIWFSVVSRPRCLQQPVDGAFYGVVLPEGAAFLYAGSDGGGVVIEAPAIGQSGLVKFEYSSPIPLTADDFSFVGGYVLVRFPPAMLNNASVEVFANVRNDILNTAECFYGNNRRSFRIQAVAGAKYEDGRKLLEVVAPPGSVGAAQIRLIANGAPPATQSARGGAGARAPLSYRVYASTQPNVQAIPSNLFASVPAGETFVDVTAAPSGSFFVVTAVGEAGEGRASNEVGGALPTVTRLKVSASKIVAQGTGFATGVEVNFGGFAFAAPASLKKNNTKVIQKGPLETGGTIGTLPTEFLPRGGTIVVLLVNPNGNAVAAEYTKP
jgi:hypothetical protein